MNSAKRRTGYGVFDLSRHVARRIQHEWENVEMPAERPWSTLARIAAPTLFAPAPSSSPAIAAPVRTEKRPLAA